MRVGIDGRAFAGNITGVGRYISELCKVLALNMPSAEFIVYCNQPIKLPVELSSWQVRIDNRKYSRDVRPVFWLKSRCGSFCSHDNLDSFWGGAAFLPSLKPSINSVISVHDVTYKVVPSSMSFLHRMSFMVFFKSDVLRAKALTVNSRGTGNRLKDFTGRSYDAVIYPAANPVFKKSTHFMLNTVLRKYSINFPFFLTACTWEPRKNLELLIKVFLDLKRDGYLKAEKLILVGGRGWKDDRLTSIAEGDINLVPLGFIPDEDLSALYTGTSAFIFPSLYEGFGIPVLEARACGATVITSDFPELHESGGSEAIYISPTYSALKDAMLNVGKHTKSSSLTVAEFPTWDAGGKELALLLQN
jgi:glycosyltransferase involved in cell wall biosynthesis